MNDIWIPILSAVVGAAVGAVLTYLLAVLKIKGDVRREIAKGILSYLALVLNRSAPEIQAQNAKALRHEWARYARELFLVSVPELNRTHLDERMVAYLQALERLKNGKETRDEVERLRDLAKNEARSFLKKMGLSVEW